MGNYQKEFRSGIYLLGLTKNNAAKNVHHCEMVLSNNKNAASKCLSALDG